MKAIYPHKKSKYGAEKATFNGRTYDSRRECEYAQTLEWRRRAGEIDIVIPQYRLGLSVCGVHIADYYVDFKVFLPDGTVEFHEVKGYETADWKLKWLMAKAIYSDVKFVLIK